MGISKYAYLPHVAHVFLSQEDGAVSLNKPAFPISSESDFLSSLFLVYKLLGKRFFFSFWFLAESEVTEIPQERLFLSTVK